MASENHGFNKKTNQQFSISTTAASASSASKSERDPLKILSSSILNSTSQTSFPIWSDNSQKKTHQHTKISEKSNIINEKNQLIGILKIIIASQQKLIHKLQKKAAFLYLKCHHYSFSRGKQSTATPKKRRYEYESQAPLAATNSSQDHLKELSKNIFSSPTRTTTTKDNYSSPIRGGKSRDIPSPFLDNHSLYSTPDRIRPPKPPPSSASSSSSFPSSSSSSQLHHPSSSLSSSSSSSSPLRPTLFTAIAPETTTPAPSHSSLNSNSNSSHDQFQSQNQSHSQRQPHPHPHPHPPHHPPPSSSPGTDEKMLSSLSNRLTDLEQLIKSLDIAIKPPSNMSNTSSTIIPPPPPPSLSSPSSPHVPLTTHPSPPHISPLMPTNLSLHTPNLEGVHQTQTETETEEEGDNAEMILHSRISTASLDALRTLHSTHREYHHPPPSSPSLLHQFQQRRSQNNHQLKTPSSSREVSNTSSSPSSYRLPQVPLTDLSLVQSKMTSWRKRYSPPSPTERNV